VACQKNIIKKGRDEPFFLYLCRIIAMTSCYRFFNFGQKNVHLSFLLSTTICLVYNHGLAFKMVFYIASDANADIYSLFYFPRAWTGAP
jgi:hypothetical protein